MKPLFSKSFWCMLAVVLLTSFSAKADIEDAIDDLFKSDQPQVTSFCKSRGNYEFTQKFVEALPGPFILYFGRIHCFPQTVVETIDACNDEETLISGWAGEEKSNKWWEGIFNTLANASSTVTNTTWDNVAPGTIKLLAVAFGLWIAVMTLQMVGSLKEQHPGDFLTKIGGKLFKIMFAAALLQNRDYFFGFFVSPIISTAAGFVGISAGGGVGVEAIMEPLKTMMEGMHTSLSEAKGVGKVLMNCLNKVDAFILVLGLDLWIVEIGTALKLFDFINGWVIASGCAIWVSALVLSVAFPFRVFDAMFRLGIILALSPLYIAAWCFDLTKDFATKGFNSVLQVAFLFMFLKITLDLCVDLIFEASGIGDVTSIAASGGKYAAGMALVGPFMTAAALGKILTIAICLLFCLGMLMKVDELANTFSSVNYSSSTADKVASKVAAPAKAAVGAVAGVAKNAVHSKFENAAINAMNNSKEGSLKRSLARSYLNSRGVTSDDAKAYGEQKAAKAEAKQAKKEQRQAQKEQRSANRTANKAAKAEKRDVRRDALKHDKAAEVRDLTRKAENGDKNAFNKLNEMRNSKEFEGKHGQAVFNQMQEDAKHPHREKAYQAAGTAIRNQEAKKEIKSASRELGQARSAGDNARVQAAQERISNASGSLSGRAAERYENKSERIADRAESRADRAQVRGAKHEAKDAAREMGRASSSGDQAAYDAAKERREAALDTIGSKGSSAQQSRYEAKTERMESRAESRADRAQVREAKHEAKDAAREMAQASVSGDQAAYDAAQERREAALGTIGSKGSSSQKDRYESKTDRIEKRETKHEAKSTLKESKKGMAEAVRSGNEEAYDAAKDQRDRSSKLLNR